MSTIATIHPVDPSAPLPYAVPAPSSGRGWLGAAIVIGGLGLVALGGCFLVGVLAVVTQGVLTADSNAPAPMTAAQITLMVILYLLAFTSFGGGATMLFLGTRALLRLMNN